MSKQAAETMEMYLTMIRKKDMEIESLSEQVRDLMIHVESGERVQNLGELQGGTIELKSTSAPKRPNRRRGK
jgi:hypothetical protein